MLNKSSNIIEKEFKNLHSCNNVNYYTNKEMGDVSNELLRQHVLVETGMFQAEMDVRIQNDGPVTIILDSKEL